MRDLRSAPLSLWRGAPRGIFDLGSVFVSRDLPLSRADAGRLIARHGRGDWGDPPLTSANENLRRAIEGRGLVSSGYVLKNVPVWIVTTGGARRVTSVLSPEDWR